jgi:hypothetical protein
MAAGSRVSYGSGRYHELNARLPALIPGWRLVDGRIPTVCQEVPDYAQMVAVADYLQGHWLEWRGGSATAVIQLTQAGTHRGRRAKAAAQG